MKQKKRSIKGMNDLRSGDKIVIVKDKEGWGSNKFVTWNSDGMDEYHGATLTFNRVASCGHIRVLEEEASLWCWYKHMVDWEATEALNNGVAEEPAPKSVVITDSELQKSFDFVKSMLRAGYEEDKFTTVGIQVPHIGVESGITKPIRVVFGFVPKGDKDIEDAPRIYTELAIKHVVNLLEGSPSDELEDTFNGTATFNVAKEGFEKFSPFQGYNLAMQRAIIEAKDWEVAVIQATKELVGATEGLKDLFADFFGPASAESTDKAVGEELKNQAGEPVTGQEEVPTPAPEEPEIPADAIRSPLYRDLQMSIGGRPSPKYRDLTLMVDAYGVVNMIKQTDEGEVSYPCRIGKLFKREGTFPTGTEARKAYEYFIEKYNN